MDLTGKKVGFLGDSITERYSASTYETCYVARFAQAHPESKVFNYGISGTKIARKLKVNPDSMVDKNHFVTRLQKMEDELDLIFVFGGTNDYSNGDIPMGKFGDTTTDSFYGCLYDLSMELIKKYTRARIVFATPLYRSDVKGATIREDGAFTLDDYAEAIRENAAYFSFPVLDLRRVSGIQPEIPLIKEKFTADGLHPNDEGHKRLFEIIDAYIKSL
ncbi:MAG: SGNH/GDSL hydrolase family protein [Clostridia bacterium]|nr:SGNH/GDSL hydrolase family protein [Clostridia bacterium]